MKNNTQQTKAFLQKALADVPEDFALSEVRYHIRAALTKLESVEKKRDKRQVAAEQRKALPGALSAKESLQIIDELIAQQKDTLNEIQNRRKKPKEDDAEDSFQTVLG